MHRRVRKYWTPSPAPPQTATDDERSTGDGGCRDVKIEVEEIGLSREERRRLERRVLLALTRFGPELAAVTVSLSEKGNPLGGVDRQCRLRARLRQGGEVRGDAIDATFELAVSRAATQVAQRVDGRISGDFERLDTQPPASSGRPPKRGRSR